MTDFESHLGRLLKAAVSDPPHSVEAVAVRARARRQVRRLRALAVAAALVVVAAAVGVEGGLTGSSHHTQRVLTPGQTVPTVAVTPSSEVIAQTKVKVTVTGFPAAHLVYLSECPTPAAVNPSGCGPLAEQTKLSTDKSGAAAGTFLVFIAATWFPAESHQPGISKCIPQCVVMATTGPSDHTTAVTAYTPLRFGTSPPSPPSALNEPPGFRPVAASFISTAQGWVLASTGCPGCAGLATTNDGGTTWTALPKPPADLGYYYDPGTFPTSVTDIAFANRSDGYLFAPALYATTDGGRTWTDQGLSEIQSVIIADGYTYALSGYQDNGITQLWRSPVGAEHWTAVALPVTPAANQQFQLVAAGASIILLEKGAAVPYPGAATGGLWESFDQGTYWQTETVPCTTADGGASLLSVALDHPDAWLILCFNGEQSSQAQNTEQHIYGTANSGTTWIRLGDPAQHNDPALLADNGSGHAFLATYGDADALEGTLNGGQTWNVAVNDGGNFGGWADLEFLTTQTGFVVGPTIRSGRLYRTTNSGQTWQPLQINPLS